MKVIEEKFELNELKGSISTRYTRPKNPLAMLVLAHGAGAGIDHSVIRDIQEELAKVDVATFAFNFLYREMGERTPVRMTKPII